jgi:hypothetical protein
MYSEVSGLKKYINKKPSPFKEKGLPAFLNFFMRNKWNNIDLALFITI